MVASCSLTAMMVDFLEIFNLASRQPCANASAAGVMADLTTSSGPSTLTEMSSTNCLIRAIGVARWTASST
eukprot:3856226-Pyramimonas_sp.AAC.1